MITIEPPSWQFTNANRAAIELFGVSNIEELTSLNPLEVSPQRQPDGSLSEEKTKKMIETAMSEGFVFFEWEIQTIDGKPFMTDMLLTRMEFEGEVILQATIRDITKRKHNENSLKRSNRALRTLSAANMILIKANDEKALLQDITDIIVNAKNGGYSFAMVCYKQDDKEESIIPMAWSGGDKSYFWEEQTDWSEDKRKKLPISIAIHTSLTQICRDIKNECKLKPWRDAALSRGYVSNIAIALLYEAKTLGAISIYSKEANSFDSDEVKLLEELANDLAYGIINLRRRIEHEKQTLLFKENLKESIQAIAATIESRDPYTAGHQRRVGELSTAIAKEMGLPENQIKGIHFAAIIHDLGKINIPAEILSKPGKLNEFEYKLIQMHPHAGYDILKDIQFPWPIADIILQHHERLNGSGYPKGLMGNKILLEAKIIGVADVVEAISSHRPYRPSLGIKYALDEITKGRGVLYDKLVVDACLKLFNEKKFKFSE